MTPAMSLSIWSSKCRSSVPIPIRESALVSTGLLGVGLLWGGPLGDGLLDACLPWAGLLMAALAGCGESVGRGYEGGDQGSVTAVACVVNEYELATRPCSREEPWCPDKVHQVQAALDNHTGNAAEPASLVQKHPVVQEMSVAPVVRHDAREP